MVWPVGHVAAESQFELETNMTHILKLAAALALVLAAVQSQAAVFERDWLAPGDGLLTYDDVNKREWLDLSVSA